MCLILCYQHTTPGLKTIREDIEEAATSNPHGLGVFWIDNGTVRWKREVEPAEAADIIKTHAGRFPAVVHARFATVGGIAPHLIHPFPIERIPSMKLEGRSAAVLAHNGHVGGWEHLAKKHKIPKAEHYGAWSDSRVLASVASRSFKAASQAALGDRLLILQGNGTMRLYGTWHAEGNVMRSGPRWSRRMWDTGYTYTPPARHSSPPAGVVDSNSPRVVTTGGRAPACSLGFDRRTVAEIQADIDRRNADAVGAARVRRAARDARLAEWRNMDEAQRAKFVADMVSARESSKANAAQLAAEGWFLRDGVWQREVPHAAPAGPNAAATDATNAPPAAPRSLVQTVLSQRREKPVLLGDTDDREEDERRYQEWLKETRALDQGSAEARDYDALCNGMGEVEQ